MDKRRHGETEDEYRLRIRAEIEAGAEDLGSGRVIDAASHRTEMDLFMDGLRRRGSRIRPARLG
ncbi:MAG TPA: hypothetical protein VGD08_00800 [Stellaceae bacterium]|jgi:hypothetical protein